jgi:predicted DNA-binding protein (MmcQ/YjbR family)
MSKVRMSRKDSLVEFCRALPGATEDVKWAKDLIFSVGGRMFAGFQMPDGQPIAFKVDPDAFDPLVARPGFVPAPYMAHLSWVSVPNRRKVKVAELKALLADAHRLVGERLSRKKRLVLGLDRAGA